jgi:hypothetical protein
MVRDKIVRVLMNSFGSGQFSGKFLRKRQRARFAVITIMNKKIAPTEVESSRLLQHADKNVPNYTALCN